MSVKNLMDPQESVFRSCLDFAKHHGKVEVVNVSKISASNSDIYSRLFVESKSVDLIISTSGSYDERRYISSLSVDHNVPMIDLGSSLGTGHVQVHEMPDNL